jgi:hypothetical protein
MPSTTETTAPETVTAQVQFTVNTGETPKSLVKKPGEGLEDRSGTFEWRDIDIHDGRANADRFDLDGEGFALVNEQTAVRDFFDDDEVRSVYYPEMERLVRRATGCDKVVVFDHTIRVGDEGEQAARKVRAPVKVVHNDFTERSAPQVQSDMIYTERDYGERVGAVYNVAYNPDQRWYYFPRMATDEVVLLKCFDSLTDGTARWTAHGSFDNPNAPADALPRQSIEIRTLYFYD